MIGLRRPDGSFVVTPDPDVVIGAGDVLIVIGTDAELKALEDLVGAERLAS